MIELKNIKKEYHTGGMTQKALDDINIIFRNNEFVSILGQSGSGKTTLLNIVGGLDQADSGDLLINGNSTKGFKDRNWDSYRNNSIGFVFQSYNLIPHQTILSNVELALTLSGVSKKERLIKAENALEKVGLKDHINKKPNQLSGGQMQRVAIARALVNDPDILLADEPTGALDSETSEQIMDLLKEIAHDRLVIMVTHNPELADKYSTRIVELKDGKIISDSRPVEESHLTSRTDLNMKKTKMSYFTALSLSLNNLMTKKGRTILTAFAGSIGIIGIALILSLSSGVNDYIANVQEDTLTSFPLTIEEKAQDLSKIFSRDSDKDEKKEKGFAMVDKRMTKMLSSNIQKNDLKTFKKHIDDNKSKFNKYLNDIQYSYNLNMLIFEDDKNHQKVLPSLLDQKLNPSRESMKSFNPMMTSNANDTWKELMDNKELIKKQYDLLEGHWPEKYNQAIVMLDSDGKIDDMTLFALGLKTKDDLDKMFPEEGGKYSNPTTFDKVSYEKLVGLRYKLILKSDLYKKEDKIWVDKSDDKKFLDEKINKGDTIEIVGVIKPKATTQGMGSKSQIGYLKDLSDYLIKKLDKSEVIKAQLDSKDINIFTNTKFIKDEEKEEFKFENLSDEEKLKFQNMKPEELTEYVNRYNDNVNASYEDNLKKLGQVDVNNPNIISFYPKSFEDKEEIKDLISEYNESHEKTNNKEDKKSIVYTDQVGLLMSSVTSIVNMISYVLIAFVAISLVVSSIMIAIITYISVLERTKEIGILRSIGASKKDISRVFTAETFIEGLVAGIMGIAITFLINIPINNWIYNLTNVEKISKLPIKGSLILILISVVLTVIAGIIPSRIAAKKDPIEALRSE